MLRQDRACRQLTPCLPGCLPGCPAVLQGVTKSRAYNARIVAETAKLTELEEK